MGILHLETHVDEVLPVVPHLDAAVVADPADEEAVPAVGATGRDGAESRLPVLALDHGLALLARGRQVPQPHRGIVRARQEFLLDLWMPVAGVDLQGREGYNYFFIIFFGCQIFSPTCAVWPLLRVWSSTYWSPLRHSSITPPSRSRSCDLRPRVGAKSISI